MHAKMRPGDSVAGEHERIAVVPFFYRDALRLEHATGSRWVETRRPELCGPLIVPTGKEGDTRFVRFDEARG